MSGNESAAVKPKAKRSYMFPITIISISFFLYYILFMRRQFIRSDQRLPFFWDRSLNKTLKQYVDILPSKYTMFLTGAYESGKSRHLYNFSTDLLRKQRLVINFDATKFSTSETFLEHALIAIRKSLIDIRPYLTSSVLKEIAPSSIGRAHFTPVGLDPSLLGVYNNLAHSLKSIVDDDGNVQSTGVHNFFESLDSYRESLKPVLFIHGGDYLYNSPLFEIVRSIMTRKNQYQNYIPVVIELRDSSILFDFEECNILNKMRVSTAGDLNETALDILIRSKLFTSFEIRRISSQIGSQGGPLAHVLEDLKFDTKIEKAIENEIKAIETKVLDVLRNNVSNYKSSTVTTKLCKGNGHAFIAERNDLVMFKPLFKHGFLYVDEMLHTHVANKAVLRAICAR
ncbi:hypothetical protein TRFO_05246 [Tritrichomonas foetus]|uniref:ATPase domain-containing protein n=1 Tax=Tritrichomonas foetus TaxID=1144522 RepID=A0A1J4KDP8_9EUKA|nr:hypothetical protein TRFO_05246 [Tritrichomonas foetus]|eukprot:OHT07589.1 hypothetical protein TRFO_05246 [Tritrichomonas foetus]